MTFRKAAAFCWNHKLTADEKRNFRLGGLLSLYGTSFAVEKFLLAIGSPLSDTWWCVIYGACALLATVWWLEDYVMDVWESYNN